MKAILKHNNEKINIEGDDKDGLIKASKEIFERYFKAQTNELRIEGEKYKCVIKIELVKVKK